MSHKHKMFRLHLRALVILAQPLAATPRTPESTPGAGRTFACRTSPTSHKHGMFPRTNGLQMRTFEQTRANARRRSILGLPHTIHKHRVFPTTTDTPTTPQSTRGASRTFAYRTSHMSRKQKKVSGNHRLGEGRTCAYRTPPTGHRTPSTNTECFR